MDLKTALFISQEITPYLPETVQSILGRDVPQSLQDNGVEVRTFMPKYSVINERRNQLHEVIRLSGLNIVIDDTDHPLIIKVATMQHSRMQVYFIDNDDYFMGQKKGILETDAYPEDNDERTMFFTRGVIETVRKLRWVPSMVHCSGWITALTPLYIRRRYADDPVLAQSKIVYSLFGFDVPRQFDSRMLEKLKMDGFSDEDITALGDGSKIDAIALGKLAIDFSDAIIQATDDAIPELVEYARQSGKPFVAIDNNADDVTAQYRSFYKSL